MTIFVILALLYYAGSALLSFLLTPHGCLTIIVILLLSAIFAMVDSCHSSPDEAIEEPVKVKKMTDEELERGAKRIRDSIMRLDPYYSREEFKPHSEKSGDPE